MIWQNPWAWLGIAGVALPILIHLLGRGHARVIRFPSLRFIDASRLLPTKRSRIQDPLLLAVRIAIVACAAIALTQPLVLTRGRRQTLDRGLARAVIVDTSVSVQRGSIDSARATARRLATQAQSSIVVESANPTGSLAGAAAWVTKQQRRGEIVVVSDFQRGQVAKEDLNALPPTIGIVLQRVPLVSRIDSVIVRSTSAGRVSAASAALTTTGTDVAWHGASDSTTTAPVELLAGRDDAAAIAALQTAAATPAVPLPIDTSRAIAIVFLRYVSRESLVRTLAPARAPWKLSLLAEVRRLALPFAAAGDATVGGRRRFVLVVDAEPTSLDAAQLVSLARRATSSAPPAAELEPSVVPDEELKTWERAAAPVTTETQYRPSDENGPSDARWLWAGVLVLLLVEWRLRRVAAATPAATVERARAA